MSTDRSGSEEPGSAESSEAWVVFYAGVACRRPDAPGLRHLATLLSRPRAEVSALVLEQGNKNRDVPRRPQRVELHDSRERALASISAEIAAALDDIAAEHPTLAHHLRASLQIGPFCVYVPEPDAAGATVAPAASLPDSAPTPASR